MPDIPDEPGHALPAVYTGAARRAVTQIPPDRDAVYAVIRYARDVMADEMEEARKPVAIGFAMILTSAVLGGIAQLIAHVPWLGATN